MRSCCSAAMRVARPSVLDNPTCLRLRLDPDGRIVEVWEFVWDLYHVDEFWS